MSSTSDFEQYDMQQLHDLFAGKRLNASQAARVAGVQRPVIATWASRHKGSFPEALPQDGGTRETLYDALEFVVWASDRPKRNRSFEEMLVSAAVESSVSVSSQGDFQGMMRSLLTLVLAYRVVDPVSAERPTSLLGRYARAASATVKNIEPLLLKVSAQEVESLACLAFVLARFSRDVLGDAQNFSAMVLSRQNAGEQLSTDFCTLVSAAGAKFDGDIRLHLANGADSAVAVQVAQSLLMSRDVQHELVVTDAGGNGNSFARALMLVADEELLLLEQSSSREWNPSAIFVLFPLAKSAVDSEKQWFELESVLLDAPVGVPLFVVSRAEVLGSAFELEKSSAQRSVLEDGHLLALVACGARQLVTESGARLMVGVFENQRVSKRQPLIALMSAAESGVQEQEVPRLIHDVESVLFESRHKAVHSSAGEHQLSAGTRVRWEDLQAEGFDTLLVAEARSSDSAGALHRIERNVGVLNDDNYEPESLAWSVNALTGMPTRTLKSARDDGKLRRLAGVSALRLKSMTQNSAGQDSVRVVDVASMLSLQATGALPESYPSVSAYDLLVEQKLEMAHPGDLLVLEGTRPVVLPARAELGLVIAQAPVFVLRRTAVRKERAEFCLDAFAGLVQAALDTQIADGAAKATWGKARVAGELLDAVLTGASNHQVNELNQQLQVVHRQKQLLQERLSILKAVEADTLSGLANGSLRFN